MKWIEGRTGRETQKKAFEFLTSHVREFGYPPTLTNVAKKLGLGKSSTCHLLQRMEKYGTVEQRADRRYWPMTPLVLSLPGETEAGLRGYARLKGITIDQAAIDLLGRAVRAKLDPYESRNRDGQETGREKESLA